MRHGTLRLSQEAPHRRHRDDPAARTAPSSALAPESFRRPRRDAQRRRAKPTFHWLQSPDGRSDARPTSSPEPYPPVSPPPKAAISMVTDALSPLRPHARSFIVVSAPEADLRRPEADLRRPVLCKDARLGGRKRSWPRAPDWVGRRN